MSLFVDARPGFSSGRLGSAVLCCGIALLSVVMPAARSAAEPLAEVDVVNLADLDPALFSDVELDEPESPSSQLPMPYYLKHFHRLANAVKDQGPDRGFIDIEVWRSARDNKPYNARIMENILSLTYFYVTDRPWNPYRGDPALRARLEAALRFWLSQQNPDGRFAEYAPDKWSVSPTGFATKFMGHALLLLHREGAPSIDAQLLKEVVDADRRALMALFNDVGNSWAQGRNFSNQYGNAWPGALMYLRVVGEDPPLRELLQQRLEQAREEFCSAAGYYYEAGGAEWSYAFNTHLSNLTVAAGLATPGSAIHNLILEEITNWTDWLSYNAVPEPDGELFLLNRGIESRKDRGYLTVLETPLAREVPLLRAFCVTAEEVQTRQAEQRSKVAGRWPEVPSLEVPKFWSYSPYAFLMPEYIGWNPTQQQRRDARAQLPYLQRDAFVHQRVDDRYPEMVYTFVRQPGYYLAFNDGRPLRKEQRYGLGLLWHPRTGTVIQTQSASDPLAWGTIREGDPRPLEAGGKLSADYLIDDQPVKPRPGVRDLADSGLVIDYDKDGMDKQLDCRDPRQIRVAVRASGSFSEQLPLVHHPKDQTRVTPTDEGYRFELLRHDTRFVVDARGARAMRLETTDDAIEGLPLSRLIIEASDQLDYALLFEEIREPG